MARPGAARGRRAGGAGPSARDHATTVARRAVELGINLVDTAFMYGWGAESRPSHRRDGAMSARFRG